MSHEPDEQPGLHDGSNAGQKDTDLYMGNKEAEVTPAAMQRLIRMLSGTRTAGSDNLSI